MRIAWHTVRMAVIVLDCVTEVRCDDCPRLRTIVSERDADLTRVTVLAGCPTCEGSTVVV